MQLLHDNLKKQASHICAANWFVHNVSFWAQCLIFVLQVEERKRLHQELMEKLNRQGVADGNEVC